MVYFNYISMGLICVFIIIAALVKKKRPLSDRWERLIESRRFEAVFIVLVLIVSAALRLVELNELPAGMNQDEASIGYDSWAIANYGVDRNGYHYPVYPVAWGAGHGPFYMYAASLFIKIFGNSLFVYRLPQALLGILSVFVLYLLLKKTTGRFIAYTGALLLAVSPWHIMTSRWGLDANPAPFLILFGLYFFVKGCQDKKTWSFVLAAALFSVSLYTYASTYIVVPIMLVILLIYALVRRYIKVKQLLISGVVCALIAVPLAMFWIVNIFKLPEINTALFSVPRLTALRSGSVFLSFDGEFLGKVIKNVANLFSLLFSYPAKEIYNVIDGFNIIYVFTFPLVLLGGFLSFKRAIKLKSSHYDFVMCAWFIASFLFSLVVDQNINRINVIFIPVVYFAAVGIGFLADRQRELCAVVLCLIMAASGLFVSYYFGPEYRRQIGVKFMHGFGEAAQYADSLDRDTVYCADLYTDSRVNGGYLLLMYYCKVEPARFYETVQYYNNDAEFRFAKSFDRYSFVLPQDMTADEYKDDVFILPSEYANRFDSRYSIETFDHFIVVSRAR